MSRRTGRLLKTLFFISSAGVLVSLARCAFSSPRYKGEPDDHFDGVRFHNSPRVPHGDFGQLVRWILTRDRGGWTRDLTPPQFEPPPERWSGLRVTLINHATTLIQYDGVNILTDPIWSERCSPVSFAGPRRFRAPGLPFEELPPIDLVLLSHNHYDHLDLPTLRRLQATDGPRVLAPLGVAALLRKNGIDSADDFDWWDAATHSSLRITAVPAQHFSSRGLCDRDATLWCGWVLSGSKGAVFFAGDTGYGPHFGEIARRLSRPRLALLPIGAYRPEWFMKPVHMGPGDARKAAADLGAELSIPIHFGTFALGDDGEEEPADVLRALLDSESGEEFRILANGQSVEL